MGHGSEARKVSIAGRQEAALNLRAKLRSQNDLAKSLRKLSWRKDHQSVEEMAEKDINAPADLSNWLETQRGQLSLGHRPQPTPLNAPPLVSDLTRALAQQDFRNQLRWLSVTNRLRIGRNGLWDRLSDWTVGYGYAPARSLRALFLLFLLAFVLSSKTWTAGDFAPNSDVVITSAGWIEIAARDCDHIPAPCTANPAEVWSAKGAPGMDWDSFSALGYAADLVIPILDLGQTDAWAPSKDRGPMGWLLWWGRWVFAAMGWIVTALGAAAVTGIIQRERE